MEISKQLDYSDSKKTQVFSSLRLSSITPQSGSSSLALLTAGSSEVVFDIPSGTQCVNLGASYITFDALIASQGGRTTSFWHNGGPFFEYIRLTNRTGVPLCDLPSASNYLNCVALPATKWGDYESFDIPVPEVKIVTGTTDVVAGVGDIKALNDGLYSPTYTNAINVTANLVRTTNLTSKRSSQDTTPLGSVDCSAVNRANAIRVIFPLNRIPHTLLSIDKSIYFAEPLQLRIGFAGCNKIGYTDDVGNGNNTFGTGIVACTLSSLKLRLAVETNLMICQQLMDKVSKEGLRMTIPYVNSFKMGFGASPSNVVNQRLSGIHGKNWLRSYLSITHLGDQQSYLFTPNVPVAMYTSVDNKRTTDTNLLTASGDIYAQQLPLFKGSAMASSSVFSDYWVYVEENTGFTPSTANDEIASGRDISEKELIYSVYYEPTGGLATNFFCHNVCQKTLSITSAGVSVL